MDKAMDKYNIAIFFGGCSSEYSVSLESAYAVICNINRALYRPVLIGITQEGNWLHFSGDAEKIKKDIWKEDESCVPALLSPDKGAHTLFLQKPNGMESISIDAVLPILHGKNGEDGTIQGMIELAGIPLAGCGTLSSALCMDKDRAHKLVGLAGVRVPKSMVLEANMPAGQAADFGEAVGYPLFVKPVKAGSSYGITKVSQPETLMDAISLAFQYDNQVILEENIDGFEVGCAILGVHTLTVGEVDEIELSDGFFDFTEKYTLKTSAIHVPARIPAEKAEEIKRTAKVIYRALDCSGFARVDMFLTPDGEIVFNEVNTIPGFTEHSRYPGMMKAAGISFSEMLERILRQAVRS